MKRIYKILLIFGLSLMLISNAFSQVDTLVVVKVVAIDTDDSGYFNAVEIEFNQPVDDDTQDKAEWKFSKLPDVGGGNDVGGNSFYTEVEHIYTSDLANDRFIRIGFNGSDAKTPNNTYDTVFIKYNGANDFLAYYNPQNELRDTVSVSDTKFYALDYAGPKINAKEDIIFSPGDGETRGINDTIQIEITVNESETGITADTLIINNTYVPKDSLKPAAAGVYTFEYIIAEGNNDINDATTVIPINFVLADANGNLSTPFTESILCPGIDANRPDIISVTFLPDNGTLAIGDSVRVEIYVSGAEENLNVDTVSINGKSVKSTFSDLGGGVYEIYYKVQTDDLPIDDDSDPLPVYIVLNDGYNKSDTINSSLVTNTPGVYATKPILSGSINVEETGMVTSLVGDRIKFTVNVTVADENLTVNPQTFNGKNLNWTSENGGLKYTGIYVVAEGDQDRDNSYDLTNVTLTDIAGNVSDSKTGDITLAIDANTPEILSMISNVTTVDTLIDGGQIIFTIDIKDAESPLTINPTTYNGVDLGWTPVGGGDTYTGIYDVTEGDKDQGLPLQLTGVTASDPLGNVSNTFNGSDVAVAIDAHTPFINLFSVTETGVGTSLVGDKITFTIDVDSADASLTVSTDTYNNQSLNWFTNDGGDSYIGIYTVTETDPDQSLAMDLLNVKLTDPAGNVSNAKTGNVLFAIDANSPKIDSVRLLNKPKKINETDTLIVYTKDELNYSGYSSVTGNIAGYNISSFLEIDKDSLYAFFTVQENGINILETSSINVGDLQIKDLAGNLSNIKDTTIIQDNDALYGKMPTANINGSDAVCDGDSTIASVFLSGIQPFSITYSDGENPPEVIPSINSNYYEFNAVDNTITSSMNYSIVSVMDATGNSAPGVGIFTLNIHILNDVTIDSPSEGDDIDISTDSVILQGNYPEGIFTGTGVVTSSNNFIPSLAKVGTHSIYYNYTNGNGCSDADTVTVDVIQGGGINFDPDKAIFCSYTDSFLVYGHNEIDPLTGYFVLEGILEGIAFNNLNTDTAVVRPQNLVPGSYNLIYHYTGGDSIVKGFTIQEVDPNITFTSIGSHCADYETIEIKAENLSPLGGDGYFTFSGGTVDINYTDNNITLNAGELTPDGQNPKTYTLEYFYITQNGCSSDTVTEVFDINPLPVVNLPMDGEYNLFGGLKTITPNIPNGTYGPTNYWSNITVNTGDFDPEQAELGIDTTWYIYTDAKGCTNIDSAFINVKEPSVVFTGLNKFTYESETKNQYCSYNSKIDTITVNPSEPTWTDKKFFIDEVLILSFAEDSVLLDPGLLSAGNHIIKYAYKEGSVDYEIEEAFNVDSIGDVHIEGLVTDYCMENESEIVLEGKYPAVEGSGKIEFSGKGIDNGVDDEYAIFIPANAALGNNAIICQFTRDYSGCKKDSTEIVILNKTPDINFELDKVCVVDKADSVLFTSDTLMSDNVVEWFWRVNNSETIRESNADSSKFSLVPQNNNLASLTLTTDKGCTSYEEKTIFIGSEVDLDFTWDKECDGETITFNVLQNTDPVGVDSIKWDFGGSGIEELSDIYNPQKTYDDPGGYDVVYKEYTNTCGLISENKKIYIRPKITIGADNYFEDFEQNSEVTGWAVDIESTSSSWDWGSPSGVKINSAASGLNAIVTNLSGPYNSNEKSYISSPCFDFSTLTKPMIKFDFISALEVSRDGVILEYSINKDEWNSVGVYGEGVLWYNSFNLTGNSLGQSSGWNSDGLTLNPSASDTLLSWNNAKYWLDEIAGNAGVRFRFVLASDGFIEDEGFGFDNVWIGDRKRLVLLEHFANYTEEEEFNNAQSEITSIVEDNPQDVIPIQFFTSFPITNDISNFYTAGPSARSLYYGISQVPYSIVDGGNRQFSHTEPDLVRKNVNKRMLEESKFEVKVKQGVSGSNLNVKATIRAIDTLVEPTKLSIRVVVVEKSVGDDSYMNVVRAMLPDPAGVLFNKGWEIGDSINLYQSWKILSGANVDSLVTVVYIQNEDSKEIYQAGYTDTFGTITSIDENFENILDIEYVVYPNPTDDILTVKLYKSLTYDLDINIYNNIGALVKSEKLFDGNIQKEINTKDLPVGIYYLKLGNTNKLFGTKKIIKTN